MENASNALLITGGILIAILIISLGIGIFLAYTRTAEAYETANSKKEILSINKDFTKFDTRADITIDEIITAVNLAKEYKETQKTYNKIEIFCDGVNLTEKTENYLTEMLIGNYYKNSSNSEKKTYRCTSIGTQQDGIVNQVVFNKN